MQLIGIAALLNALSWKASKDRVMHVLDEPASRTVGGTTVSVVIPALQEEGMLPDLLASLNNQTHPPMEVLVYDQSPQESKTETRKLAESYGARVIDGEKVSVAYAMHEAAKSTVGEVLMFIAADCVVSSDHVETLVRGLGSAKLAMTEKLYHDSFIGKGFLYNLARPFWPVVGIGVSFAMRTEDYFASGGWDPNCQVHEECDLLWVQKVEGYFGAGSVNKVRGVTVCTSARRPWFSKDRDRRGYRNGQAIDRFMVRLEEL